PVRERWSFFRKKIAEEQVRCFFREQLRDHLYKHFYCTGRAVPGAGSSPSWPRRADVIQFLRSLSLANRGLGPWQSAWRAEPSGNPRHIHRDGSRLYATGEEYRPLARGENGWAVSLRMPKELYQASPGYSLALGNEPLDFTEPVVRMYWNTDPVGAVSLVGAVT